MFNVNKGLFGLISVSLFMILFSMIFSADAFAALACSGSQQACCKNGQLSCCPNPGTDSRGNHLSYDLSGCVELNDSLLEEQIKVTDSVSECTPGVDQYQPSGDCNTSSRKCCPNGKWSGWGESCPKTPICSSSQCLNGSSCESKGTTSRTCVGNVANTTGGNQTRTATCNSGSGWSYGKWIGICTCKTNFTWSGSSCTKGGSGSGLLDYSWKLHSVNNVSCPLSPSCGSCSSSNAGTVCRIAVSGETCEYDCTASKF